MQVTSSNIFNLPQSTLMYMMASENDILLETLGKELNQSFSLPAEDRASYQQILERLIAHIRPLIDKDFNQLIYLLYRIDVPEKKVTEMLDNHPDKEAAFLIASLILERTLQKIQIRQQFSNRDTIIPEDEKW